LKSIHRIYKNTKIGKGGVTVVISIEVAEKFNKRHTDVMKAIRELGYSKNSDSAFFHSPTILILKAKSSPGFYYIF